MFEITPTIIFHKPTSNLSQFVERVANYVMEFEQKKKWFAMLEKGDIEGLLSEFRIIGEKNKEQQELES